jgi:hypothetical protein
VFFTSFFKNKTIPDIAGLGLKSAEDEKLGPVVN